MKPLIGIITNLTWETEGEFAGYKKSYVSLDYSRAVEKSGAIPVLIPLSYDTEMLGNLTGRLDGIIVSGGQDVNPITFGDEPLEKLGQTLDIRDVTDTAVINKALEIKKPLFGICRGHQIINRISGGTIIQDTSYAPFKMIQHTQKSFPDTLSHSITTSEGSIMREIFGEKTLVNSFHHQIVGNPGKGMVITSRASDSSIESTERISNDEFILTVQFHPEMTAEKYPVFSGLFDKFTEACRKGMK